MHHDEMKAEIEDMQSTLFRAGLFYGYMELDLSGTSFPSQRVCKQNPLASPIETLFKVAVGVI